MPYNLRKRPATEPIVIKRQKKEPQDAKGEPPRVKKEPRRAKKEPPKVKEEVEKTKKELQKPKEEPPTEKGDADPCLHIFGVDGCGELGLGKIGFTKKLPTKLPIDGAIQQVACGPMHTVVLMKSGQVYTCGCNDEGALGRVSDGDSDLESTSTLVLLPNQATKITAGDSHSAALTTESEVFVWGNFRDEHGSVGLAPSANGEATFKPIQISSDIKFKDIASGSNHMLLLDTDGCVYSFGVGAQGQLGRVNQEDTEGGEIKTAKERELFLTPTKVGLTHVDPQRPFVCDAIYAGNNSSFATNTDKKKNRLAGWGLNNYYQLGFKGELVQFRPKRSTFTCSTSMVGVACGQHHTLYLTRTGRVYAAGRHNYGMLGLGGVSKEVCPAKRIDAFNSEKIINIDAGINTSFAVTSDGKLYAWGMSGPHLGLQSDDDTLSPTLVKSLENRKVMSVSSEGEFTAVIALG